MAKSTHAQEASTGTPDSYTAEEIADVEHVRITRPYLDTVDLPAQEVKPSVGSNLTQSSGSESNENDRQNPSHQQPAQTTDNPLSPTPTGNSDVPLTDGDGPKTEPRPSGKGRQTPPTKAAPKKASGARATVMRGAEDDDF